MEVRFGYFLAHTGAGESTIRANPLYRCWADGCNQRRPWGMGCDKRTDNGNKVINDFPLGKKGRRGERNGGEELGREF